MTLKTKKMEYVEWNDIEKEFRKLCKKKYGKERDLRDWTGKFSSDETYDDSVPYQDFWHVMCDSEMIANDKITSVNFHEWWLDTQEYSTDPDDKWMAEVLELLAEVCGDRDLHVLFSW